MPSNSKMSRHGNHALKSRILHSLVSYFGLDLHNIKPETTTVIFYEKLQGRFTVVYHELNSILKISSLPKQVFLCTVMIN